MSFDDRMSALGHEQTSRHIRVMSVIPLKADIHQRGLHVRLVPVTEIGSQREGLLVLRRSLAVWPVVPSENLIRWIRSRKENRIMIETDGDLRQTSARIYVGLLSFT